MLTSKYYSQKQLFGKNNNDRLNMIGRKGDDWYSQSKDFKYGTFIGICKFTFTNDKRDEYIRNRYLGLDIDDLRSYSDRDEVLFGE